MQPIRNEEKLENDSDWTSEGKIYWRVEIGNKVMASVNIVFQKNWIGKPLA
jgi:hypothetical protein